MKNIYAFILIILAVISTAVVIHFSSNKYNALEGDYSEDYSFYDEWKMLDSSQFLPNHYSEYLYYQNSSYSAGRINDYYSLSFNNYNADEGFDVTVDLTEKSCVLHVVNNSCFRNFEETANNPYPTNCDKDYVIGNKPQWMKQ